MVSVVDESVKNVTVVRLRALQDSYAVLRRAWTPERSDLLLQALKHTGMWSSTVFVWTTDNGSPVQAGGSNHPRKSCVWIESTRWQRCPVAGF